MKKSFLFCFLVLSFTFYNCIGKTSRSTPPNNIINPPIIVTPPITDCLTNDDCHSQNPCLNSLCENNFCVEHPLENSTTCGNSQVCYEGECFFVDGTCAADEDCTASLNSCQSPICMSNSCVYTNVVNGTGCEGGRHCINGTCNDSCYLSSNCVNTDSCKTVACSSNVKTLEEITTNSRQAFKNGYWWVFDVEKKKVFKYNSSWLYQNFSFSLSLENLPGSIDSNISVDYSKIYIQYDYFIYVYNYTGNLLQAINLRTDSNIPTNISGSNGTSNLGVSAFFNDGTYWWIFGTYTDTASHILAYKLNSNFTYLSYVSIPSFQKQNTAFFDGTYWFFSRYVSNTLRISKYDSNFAKLDDPFFVFQLGSYIPSSIYLVNNTWTLLMSKKIYEFTKEFSVNSFCFKSNVLDGTKCNSNTGYCNSGFCAECSANQHCNDSNNCTVDACEYGNCTNTTKEDGVTCGYGKKCLAGICEIANCTVDEDCQSDTFCRNNFCNLETHMCNWEALHENAFCTVTPPPPGGTDTYTCNAGNCIFDPTNIGLCSEPLTSTANIHGIIVADEARTLNNNQKVLAIAVKFNDPMTNTDPDLYKCAGYLYMPLTAGIAFVAFGDDTDTTPIKEGFSFGEPMNIYIRTNNYVCRVLANYDTSSYVSTNKWYPLGISKIIKFKDMNGNANIDFSNGVNCTLVVPF